MKIKHYFLFEQDIESLCHPDSWMKVRSDPAESAYYIPETIEAYHQRFDTRSPSLIAAEVISAARRLGYSKVFSPGCGIGALEYSVKQHSDLEVSVTDYNDSILRLREFGIFDGCAKLDLIQDELPDLSETLVLLPRLDTEFTDEQLRLVASKCAAAEAKHLFMIPGQMMTWKTPLIELKIWLRALFKHRRRTFCGYSRSRAHMIKLFAKFYECKFNPVGDVLVLMFSAHGQRAERGS